VLSNIYNFKANVGLCYFCRQYAEFAFEGLYV